MGFPQAAHRSGRGARALFLTGALGMMVLDVPRLLIAQEPAPPEAQAPVQAQAPAESESAPSVLSVAYTTDGPVDADEVGRLIEIRPGQPLTDKATARCPDILPGW